VIRGKRRISDKGNQNVDYKYKNLVLGLLYGASARSPGYLEEIRGEEGGYKVSAVKTKKKAFFFFNYPRIP